MRHGFLLLLLIVATASPLARLGAQDASAGPKAPGLHELLRAAPAPARTAALRTFAAGRDAPAAIPEIVAALRGEAPRLDEAACELLGLILAAHPHARCPIEPLLEVARRPSWLGRQRAAETLLLTIAPEAVAGREAAISRALIPLAGCQRLVVFRAADRCLEKLSGERFGPDAALWAAWHRRRFGETVDPSAGRHEMLVVIAPKGRAPALAYEVAGHGVGGRNGLAASLAASKAEAAARGLELVLVVQVAEEELVRSHEQDGAIAPEVAALAKELGLAAPAVASEGEVFRPFADFEPEPPTAR